MRRLVPEKKTIVFLQFLVSWVLRRLQKMLNYGTEVHTKKDHQTADLIFFAIRTQIQLHEKPTWFDGSSMVKTYDVKTL